MQKFNFALLLCLIYFATVPSFNAKLIKICALGEIESAIDYCCAHQEKCKALSGKNYQGKYFINVLLFYCNVCKSTFLIKPRILSQVSVSKHSKN